MAACRVVPIAAIVPVFPTIVHIPAPGLEKVRRPAGAPRSAAERKIFGFSVHKRLRFLSKWAIFWRYFDDVERVLYIPCTQQLNNGSILTKLLNFESKAPSIRWIS